MIRKLSRMLRHCIAIAVLASVGGIASAALADSVSLVPAKDNTLIQWTEGVSGAYLSNGLGDIFVGRTNQDGQGPATISIRRGLIQFDVANAIPSGMTVTNVSLTMRDVMGLNGDPEVKLHRIDSDMGWGEGTSYFPGGQGQAATDGDVTWGHTSYLASNPASSPEWQTEGGDYDPAVSASAIISDDLGGGHLFTWTGPGMVSDVQSWLNNPAENRGWIMIGDEANGRTAKRFDSGDLEKEPDNIQPLLTIEYALAGDYNDDGAVDAADYVVWRKNLGDAVSLPNETTSIGEVTSQDYDIWFEHYGELIPGGGDSGEVPEPGGQALALFGLLPSLLLMRRQRRDAQTRLPHSNCKTHRP